MKIEIITIFPEMFESYFGGSIVKRAIDKGKIEIVVHDLRKWTEDVHKSVDDTPYGGGAGMVMKVEPIYKALKELDALKTVIPAKAGTHQKTKTKTVLFAAGGEQFAQQTAKSYTDLDRIVMICGRYEGVDQRVANYCVDEVVSVGPYVLTGGELPAMIVTDAVTRLLPDVLGNERSVIEESFSDDFSVEYPHYTRPEVFENFDKEVWSVPDILLSGDHKRIADWRASQRKK
ncbi:MAG: tRNA (guanosine(37)-N1)-methyltransferase TrmD [Parcubacteria group bacterium]|nr:tRNA (guanosine(37)-N1)-methyltransferase TrmD [Parcubacteria group bacterium]